MPESSFAQTNLQLYAELNRVGYSRSDVVCIRAAYELAMLLFTGCYRGSGKPFIAHAAGTAGILATLRVRGAVVAAGLLHAAYTHGEFGDGWREASPGKRRRVQEAVGAEVEDLVHRYTALRWNASTIPVIRDRLDAMGAADRDVLLVRLANELEDHLDLGVLYCADAERRREFITSSLRLGVEMAQRLGFPQLAAALDQVFSETLAAEVPAALRCGEAATHIVPPATHRLRMALRLRRLLARLQGR